MSLAKVIGKKYWKKVSEKSEPYKLTKVTGFQEEDEYFTKNCHVKICSTNYLREANF